MKLDKGERSLDLSGVPFPMSAGTRRNLAGSEEKRTKLSGFFF